MRDERLSRLVEAVLTVAEDADLPSVLRRIVQAAMALSGARYGALGVIGDDRTFLSEFVYEGVEPGVVRQIGRLPEGRGILGLLIDEPRPIRLADLNEHADAYGFPEGHPTMRSFLGTPVRVGGTIFGNLYLTEKQGGSTFTEADEELVVALAAIAGSAIERVRLHEEIRRISVLEDRERIGRDLHDNVIQRLFATGLGLQALARRIEDRPEVLARVEESVDALDETIREIRSTIFQLQTGDAVGAGLRRRLLALATELAATLGFQPRVSFVGPVDTAVTPTVAEHVPPVLREALTNVAKHAHATRVEVAVAISSGALVLEIADDGRGPGDGTGAGLGLANLRQRAERLGGTSAIGGSELGGTLLRWQVPLGSPDA